MRSDFLYEDKIEIQTTRTRRADCTTGPYKTDYCVDGVLVVEHTYDVELKVLHYQSYSTVPVRAVRVQVTQSEHSTR